MPPNNKKKKKPASNPARGFATVSIPSKVKPADSSGPASTVDSKSVSESERPTPAEPTQPAPQPNEAPSLQNYTPEELERHLEDAELQILVEKYAAKCKSDAVRQAAKLDTEKRVLRQQAVPVNLLEWLPSDVVNSILSLAEAEEQGLIPQSVRDAKRTVSEDDLCMKLWTLKDTLLKLGFLENRVEEALKHVLVYYAGNFSVTNRDVVCNLDEALEWLAMHCKPEELPSYTQTGQRKDTDKNISWISGNPWCSVSHEVGALTSIRS
jgi:ATP-dependent RNA helicase DHX29